MEYSHPSSFSSKNFYEPHLYLATGQTYLQAELFSFVLVEAGKSLRKKKRVRYQENQVRIVFEVVEEKGEFEQYDAHRVSLKIKKDLLTSSDALIQVLIENPFVEDPSEQIQVMQIPFFRSEHINYKIAGNIAQNRPYLYFDETSNAVTGPKTSVLVPFSEMPNLKLGGEPISVDSDTTSSTHFINRKLETEDLFKMLVSIGEMTEDHKPLPNQIPALIFSMRTKISRPLRTDNLN